MYQSSRKAKPFLVSLAPRAEAVDAFPGAKGGPPIIVADQIEFSAANRAALYGRSWCFWTLLRILASCRICMHRPQIFVEPRAQRKMRYRSQILSLNHIVSQVNTSYLCRLPLRTPVVLNRGLGLGDDRHRSLVTEETSLVGLRTTVARVSRSQLVGANGTMV